MVVCASVCPSRSCRTAIGAPIRDVSESGCQSKQTLPGGYFIQLAIPIPGGRLWLNAKCAEMIMTRVSALKPTVKSMYSTVLNVRFKRWLPNAHIAIAESWSGRRWPDVLWRELRPSFRYFGSGGQSRIDPRARYLLEESKHSRFQRTR